LAMTMWSSLMVTSAVASGWGWTMVRARVARGAASGWALRRTRMTPGAEAVMLAVRVSPVVVAALRWIPWSVMSRRAARVTVTGLLCPGGVLGSSGGAAPKRSWGTMGGR